MRCQSINAFLSKLTTLAVVALMCGDVRAEAINFSSSDSETARLAVELIRNRHLENQPIDDALSAQLLESFVELWDPAKQYFRKSDLQQFNTSRKVLDDDLKAGKIDFAKKVFERFALRQQEMKDTIGGIIDADHDFTADESFHLNADEQDWAASDDELQERWRKRIKSELLALRLDGETDVEARKKLHRRYENSRKLLKQTESHELLEIYLSSLTRCLDPHSSYMAPRSRKEFDITMKLRLQGIGARLKFSDGNTVVEQVVPGGAAAADGRLQKGDMIIGVGQGNDGNFTDVVGLKLGRVVDQIRGAAGSIVRLKIRKPTGASVEYKLIRQTVKLEGQEAKGTIIESSEWIDGTSSRLGILSVPSFYRDFQGAASGGKFKSTSRDVRVILDSFQTQGVEALIVDLRGNGGGALDEAVEVSGLFIPRGPIVQVQAKDEELTVIADKDPEMVWRGPMVVVCDRLSASASEIFAGAIRDYRRGIIVGDKTTHGKGTVQNVMSLANGIGFLNRDRGALKLTIGKWYRVNGDGSQIVGISSDVQLPSVRDVLELGEESLENTIPFDRIEKASYVPFADYVSDEAVAALRKGSSERTRRNDEFEKLNRRIEFLRQKKQRKTISLNEATARERRTLLEELSGENGDSAESVGSATTEAMRFDKSFYNREVLQITIDYLKLLQKRA